MPEITDVPKWIFLNSHCFVPPICNKLLHQDGQLKVFFVGGPNNRKDFHIERGEEFFYMLKGNMCLRVLEQNEFQNIIIRQGDVFLLPARIPHSPQRESDTMGLVIERERNSSELDCLRYFVENSQTILFERWFHCVNLGPQLSEIIQEYFQTEEYRTGVPSKDSLAVPGPYEIDHTRKLERPFSLNKWINDHRSELKIKGSKLSLFGPGFKSRIEMLGSGVHRGEERYSHLETYLWQMEGTSTLLVNGKKSNLKTSTSVLVQIGESWEITNGDDDLTLQVIMEP